MKPVPMRRSHVRECEAIVASSDPWKRLNEHVDFLSALARKRSNTLAFVCQEGNKTAGFILFTPDPVFARGGYLRAIGVAKEFRRRGIGRDLLTFAEKITAKRSRNLFLCVSSFNRKAQAFYRGCGYRKAGSLPGLIRPGVSEYIYWKPLRSVQK